MYFNCRGATIGSFHAHAHARVPFPIAVCHSMRGGYQFSVNWCIRGVRFGVLSVHVRIWLLLSGVFIVSFLPSSFQIAIQMYSAFLTFIQCTPIILIFEAANSSRPCPGVSLPSPSPNPASQSLFRTESVGALKREK
jgi:hypothetical protein